MLYRMSFEFRLTRLAPWDDGGDFYSHVESVRAKIGSNESVEQVRAISDMAQSRLNLEFLIDAGNYHEAKITSVETVREAIENSAARHFGLDEDPASPLAGTGAGAGTGLVTPIWHHLRMLVDAAA